MHQNNNMSEMTAQPSRHFFLILDIIFPILLLAGLTILFRSTNLDMQIQSRFFNPQNGWFLKDYPLFKFLYNFGNLPALALSVFGLVMLGLAYSNHKYIKWRKVGYFLVLTMVLAPGLIINTALKDNWGRPRPRNLLAFGGKCAYEQLLTIDKSSEGKSFPCGHASMGFFLMVPWFLLRKKHPKTAVIVLFTGIVAGLAIGLARIAQGGHFASDVVWSGMLVYITAAILFYALKMNRSIWFYPSRAIIPRQHKLLIQVAFGILILIFILAVMLATPYEKERKYLSVYAPNDSVSFIKQTYTIDRSEIIITPEKKISIDYKANNFGFPGSKVHTKYQESITGKHLTSKFIEKAKGFFTEQNNTLSITYPPEDSLQYSLKLDQGNVQMTIPDDIVYLDLKIEINKGNLVLDIPSKFKPHIELKGSLNLKDNTGFETKDGIFVNPAFKISIIVREGDVTLN